MFNRYEWMDNFGLLDSKDYIYHRQFDTVVGYVEKYGIDALYNEAIAADIAMAIVYLWDNLPAEREKLRPFVSDGIFMCDGPFTNGRIAGFCPGCGRRANSTTVALCSAFETRELPWEEFLSRMTKEFEEGKNKFYFPHYQGEQ